MIYSNGVPTIWGLLLAGCLTAAVILKLVLANKNRMPSRGTPAGSGDSGGFSWGGSSHGGGDHCGGDSGSSDGGACGGDH
jgi:hypothetical protein